MFRSISAVSHDSPQLGLFIILIGGVYPARAAVLRPPRCTC